MAVVTTKVLETATCQVWKVANAVTATPSAEIPAAAEGWTEAQILIGAVAVDSTGATVDVLVYALPVTGSAIPNTIPAMSANELRAKYTKSGAVKEAGRVRSTPPYLKVGFVSDAAWDVDLYVCLTRQAVASVA